MAKICSVCGSLCAYFLLFLNINAVLSINDYHGYSVVDGEGKAAVSVQLIDRGYRLQKRDTENNQSNSPIAANATLLANGTFAFNKSKGDFENNSNVSSNKTLTDQKITSTKTKLAKTTKNASNNTTIMPNAALQDNLQKNLGVNGTGQRKLITVTVPPAVEPVILLNSTANTNQSLISFNSTSCDSDEMGDDEDCVVSEESEAFNKTLQHNNITITRYDNHLYYNSTVSTSTDNSEHWVELANITDAKVNEHLSKSHRRAATVKLSFEFPFYGHLIKNVTIATGGFLYTGDYVHSWLAATQYIAPLMANFDTSISNDSFIRYWDSGSAFTVEWEKVALQDRPNEGEFTFQTTLHKNGDIAFVYKSVPPFVKNIEDVHHPVKVGLSDAYIIDRTVFFVRRKTIYEYHRVNFPKEDLRNGTVIYLKALPTCLQNTDCTSCTTNKISGFQCQWCPTVGKCSNGLDRNRQDWLSRGCDKKQFNNETYCSHISSSDIFDVNNMTYSHDSNEFQHHIEDSYGRVYNAPSKLGPNQPVKMSVSSIMAILFLIAMVSGLTVWIMYAYRNPHTTSGQILIRYRPSQWKWRRGEARYTAATIHM